MTGIKSLYVPNYILYFSKYEDIIPGIASLAWLASVNTALVSYGANAH